MQRRGVQVTIGGEELLLLPSGAAYWDSRSALLVADLHLGKAAAFRAQAVPVPSGSTDATLDLLSTALRETEARRVYILGDLWHAKSGRTVAVEASFGTWRQRHAGVEVILIEGNHDVRSGRMLEQWGVQVSDTGFIGPLVLKHLPEPDERGYVLSGHVHPAVRLVGRGRQTERLRCFWFGSRVGVLPAFGGFTGAATVYPQPQDRVFVLTGSEVVEVGLTAAGRDL